MPNRVQPRYSPSRIANRRRAEAAVLLRARGYRYQDIADELAYPTADAARKALNRFLDAEAQATVHETRRIIHERIELLLRSMMDPALGIPGPIELDDEGNAVLDDKGKPRRVAHGIAKADAVREARQLLELLARLDGLTAPAQLEVSGPHGTPIPMSARPMTEEEMREYARRWREVSGDDRRLPADDAEASV